MEIAPLLKKKRGTLLDVRSMKNLQEVMLQVLKYPAQEIPHRIQEIQELKTPLILFCAW
jgi:hypothetical protein